MRIATVSILSAIVLLSSGCVTQQTHEAALKELAQTRQALSSAEQTIREQQEQIRRNTQEIEQTKQELSELESKKKALTQEHEKAHALLLSTRSQLDQAQSQLNDLQSRLSISQERLHKYESQLVTLRTIEAETKNRNEIYARFIQKLRSMIDGGELTVTIEKGRLVINLPENVLFETGRTMLSQSGKNALIEIASVMKELPDRRFQIEGHTDNVPIHNAHFASNWELSAGRALRVVHLMTQEGVYPANLSAAGFGEYQPRADNTDSAGKALNRRIEIVMLPNLDILSNELPTLSSHP